MTKLNWRDAGLVLLGLLVLTFWCMIQVRKDGGF